MAPIVDVVVTANRRNERARAVAGSVTAISGEDLTRRQQVRIQDLQGTVPGLALEEVDKTQMRIVLRGLNSGGSGATVGTVVDDVPVNSASSLNNGSVLTPNPDTYDMQRIEVLRGPQGTLYGATAEGGLIKYVTNLPDLRTYSGSIEGGLSGLTAGGLGGTTRGYVNIPVVQGKVAVRLSGTNEYLPGYTQYCSLCDSDGSVEVDARDRLWRSRTQRIAAHLALDPARHLPAAGTRHALL